MSQNLNPLSKFTLHSQNYTQQLVLCTLSVIENAHLSIEVPLCIIQTSQYVLAIRDAATSAK